MALNIVIQGVSYAKIVGGQDYDLIPFDLSGNLFSEVTIEVDTTLGNTGIFLPQISTLNGNWNILIKVISLNGGTTGNIVYINSSSDFIGSNNYLALENDGTNVILTPIADANWYGVTAL